MKYSITQSSDKLKKLIAEHPDYDILVFAGEDANCGEWNWTACSSIRFEIGEVLDTDYYDFDDSIICDRDRLEEIVEERLYDTVDSDKLDQAVAAKVAELEPYWREVIIIYADN